MDVGVLVLVGVFQLVLRQVVQDLQSKKIAIVMLAIMMMVEVLQPKLIALQSLKATSV
jgi:hypothetical protein